MNQECAELIERWPLIKEFKLPPDSNVVVIGAYKGLAMQAISEMYNPAQVIGYEPQLWAADEAVTRLLNHYNCMVFPFGLWAGSFTGMKPMGEWHTDACSFVNTGEGSRDQGTGAVMDANSVLNALNLDKIDLVVCNIEGGEYQLIPYLREKGWLDRIDRLAVQWHWFPELNLTNSEMDQEIESLIVDDNYFLVVDERPAWTFFVRNLL